MDLKSIGKQFITGGVAGCVAKSAVAPLDRIKILLQAQHPYYRHYGVFKCMLEIYKREGLFSLWKGNLMMMIRIFPYAAIQFFSFEKFRSLFTPVVGNGHLNKLTAGASAGVVSVLITYPLDMVRTRITFQIKGEHHYKSIVHAFSTIYKMEGGLKSFYSGVQPSVIGMIPYAGVSFYSFNVLKDFIISFSPSPFTRPDKNDPEKFVLKTMVSLCCGGFAGAISQTVSFPFDVARRKMQLANVLPNSHKYKSMRSTLSYVYHDHGIIKGLYRGLSINYIRVIPQQAIAFTVYDFVREVIG